MATTKSDSKTEIIQKFTSVLNQHCRNEHDVFNVIKALQDASSFMQSTLYAYDRDHGFRSRHIRGYLDKAPAHILKEFNSMDDSVSSALIISGQNAGALHLIDTSMHDSLNEIIDQFNA